MSTADDAEPEPLARPVITAGLAVEVLGDATPSFATSVRRPPRAEMADRAGPHGPFVWVVALAMHAVDLVREGVNLDEVDAVAAAAEEIVERGDPDAVELVEVALVGSWICLCSHPDSGLGREDLLPHLRLRLFQRWHQRQQWLEAVSTDRQRPSRDAEALIEAQDPWARALGRATSYRAENGRLVPVAELFGGDDVPRPRWVLRLALAVIVAVVFAVGLLAAVALI